MIEMQAIMLKKLQHNTQFAQQAAKWFSTKWGIPQKEYENSINQCISQKVIYHNGI